MKKLAALLLSICMLPFCTAFVCVAEAGSGGNVTTVLTEVPSEHQITVIVEGSVDVIIDGETIKGGIVDVERLSAPMLQIQPSDGYSIEQVFLNGVDITTQAVDGDYTFEPIYEDQILKIIAKYEVVQPSKPEDSSQPSGENSSVMTGDSSQSMLFPLLFLVLSVVLLIYALKKSAKDKSNW